MWLELFNHWNVCIVAMSLLILVAEHSCLIELMNSSRAFWTSVLLLKTTLAGVCRKPSLAGICRRPSLAGVCRRPSLVGVCWRPSLVGVCRRPTLAGVCRKPSLAGVCRRPSLTGVCWRPSLVGVCWGPSFAPLHFHRFLVHSDPVVIPNRVLSISQIELKCVLMLNWITWNRTVLIFKLRTHDKLNYLKYNYFWHLKLYLR